jgi:lysophospholipase L1-like esterase
MKHTVVCFGDSITRGMISANYVRLLDQRLGNSGYHFINAGVNNDYSYNLLRRVRWVLAFKPQVVTILIGTNDVSATLNPLKSLLSRVSKMLPYRPGIERYQANLVKVVQHLKSKTSARIGLASIPLLGENLDSVPNQTIRGYNERVREIARREQVGYIPVFERQEEYIRSNGNASRREYHGELRLTAELAARRIFLRESYDSFSRRKGFSLLTDGVHMNNRGAEIIAQEMEKFILVNAPSDTL